MTWAYSIRTLPINSYLKHHFGAEKCDSAKCFEEEFDATASADAACNGSLWVIPYHECELFHKMIENLQIKMSYGVHERTQTLSPERKILCSAGGPNCTSMTSKSITMD